MDAVLSGVELVIDCRLVDAEVHGIADAETVLERCEDAARGELAAVKGDVVWLVEPAVERPSPTRAGAAGERASLESSVGSAQADARMGGEEAKDVVGVHSGSLMEASFSLSLALRSLRLRFSSALPISSRRGRCFGWWAGSGVTTCVKKDRWPPGRTIV